jgi:hypothetical protein
MKQLKTTVLALSVMAAGLFAFKAIDNGSIKGTVSPAEGAVQAWALSSTDTLKAAITNGAFEITNVKPGDYRLIIEAKPPYKNVAKEAVSVKDGAPTEVGEIKLAQ